MRGHGSAGRSSSGLERVIEWSLRGGGAFSLLVAVSIAAYAVELWQLRESASGPRVFRDTRFYSVPEGTSYLSAPIWTGARSPVAMLVFKLCADERERIVDVFYMMSFAGWAFLAVAAAYAARPAFMRPIAAAAVLSLAASRVVVDWNHVMLGDGAAVTGVAACAAGGVLFLRRPGRATGVVLALTAGLCALSRDSAAYALLAIAAFALLMSAARWLATRRLNRWMPVGSAALVVGALCGYASAEVAERWTYPLLNVIAGRVIEDPEATAFFVERGMPTNRALRPGRNRRVYANDPRLAGFRDWVYEHGKKVYMRYLLAHPVRAVRAAVEHYPEVVAGPVSGYAPRRLATRPTLDAIWDRAHLVGFLGVLGFGLLAAMFLPGTFANPATVAGALAGAGTLPHAFVVYHGDAMEVARHGVAASAELRVAVALLVPGLAAALFLLARRTYEGRWRRSFFSRGTIRDDVSHPV